MSRRSLLLITVGVCISIGTSSQAGTAGHDRRGFAGRAGSYLGVAVTLPAPEAGAINRQTAQEESTTHPDCYRRIPRARKDRPDTRKGWLLHVVYLVPSDFPDEKLDARGILDCSARAQNDWFREASGGLQWRFDTFKGVVQEGRRKVRTELIDVTFVSSARPGAQLDSAFEVQAELETLGFGIATKRYLSFVASEAGPCGDAVYPINPTQSVEWQDGQYAQVYLFADEACGTRDFGPPGKAGFADMIAQQEVIHNDALVSPGAPHGCLLGVPPGAAHVCTGPLALTEGDLNLDPERIDVMYPFVSVPLSEKVLDQGNDDYFKHLFPNYFDLEDSPYLEEANASKAASVHPKYASYEALALLFSSMMQ